MLVARSSGSIPTSSARVGAARGSFAGVRVGACIPVIPFVLRHRARRGLSRCSLVALFVGRGGVSLLTGRGVLFSGFRQLGIGSARRS
jgi:hypothetical protein